MLDIGKSTSQHLQNLFKMYFFIKSCFLMRTIVELFYLFIDSTTIFTWQQQEITLVLSCEVPIPPLTLTSMSIWFDPISIALSSYKKKQWQWQDLFLTSHQCLLFKRLVESGNHGDWWAQPNCQNINIPCMLSQSTSENEHNNNKKNGK